MTSYMDGSNVSVLSFIRNFYNVVCVFFKCGSHVGLVSVVLKCVVVLVKFGCSNAYFGFITNQLLHYSIVR